MHEKILFSLPTVPKKLIEIYLADKVLLDNKKHVPKPVHPITSNEFQKIIEKYKQQSTSQSIISPVVVRADH